MKINKVQIRNLQIEDYDQLAQSFTRVYSDGSDVFWTHKQIEKLIRIFPEGQIVTVVDEKIVGCALSIIVNYDDVKNDHTYAQVTGKETFNTHNPKGNILYGRERPVSRKSSDDRHIRGIEQLLQDTAACQWYGNRCRYGTKGE